MLKVNYWFMASRVKVLLTRAVMARVFSRFIIFILNTFIMFMLKGG
jgi:hypothetical protein